MAQMLAPLKINKYSYRNAKKSLFLFTRHFYNPTCFSVNDKIALDLFLFNSSISGLND